MNQIELNSTQREILTTLIEHYLATDSPVSGETIAEAIDVNTGTLRSKIQTLTALSLVEGIPGIKGGYRPTARAYTVLATQDLDAPEPLILARDYDRVTADVESIDFVDVNHPDRCQARLTFLEAVERLAVGDAILVGPTPVTKLVVGGEVVSVASGGTVVVVDVKQLHAPLADE